MTKQPAPLVPPMLYPRKRCMIKSVPLLGFIIPDLSSLQEATSRYTDSTLTNLLFGHTYFLDNFGLGAKWGPY